MSAYPAPCGYCGTDFGRQNAGVKVPLPGDNREGETEGWRANQYLLAEEENARYNIVALPKAFQERRP